MIRVLILTYLLCWQLTSSAGTPSPTVGIDQNPIAVSASPSIDPLVVRYLDPPEQTQPTQYQSSGGSGMGTVGTEITKAILFFPLIVGAEVLGFVATCALIHCR